MERVPMPRVPVLDEAPKKPQRVPWSDKVPGEDYTYDDLLRKYYPKVRAEALAQAIAEKAGYVSVHVDALYKRRRVLKARGEW